MGAAGRRCVGGRAGRPPHSRASTSTPTPGGDRLADLYQVPCASAGNVDGKTHTTCTHQHPHPHLCAWAWRVRGWVWLGVAGRGWAWLHVAARGCTWLHVAARGCSWLHQRHPRASAIPVRRAPAPSPGWRTDAPAHDLPGRGRRGLRRCGGGRKQISFGLQLRMERGQNAAV